nr:YceI family protein [Oleiagrimonas sp. C23AA]
MPLAAHATNWKVDHTHSSLGFSDSYQGEAFHGVFKDFQAQIAYDPAHLDQAHFDVSVKLASVDTQSPERDQTLTGEEFFNTSAHPTAHFASGAFTRDSAGQVTATGTLSLNGVSHPVTLKVDFHQGAGASSTLTVTTTLNRLDYKLGTASDWNAIGKQVAVKATLALSPASGT